MYSLFLSFYLLFITKKSSQWSYPWTDYGHGCVQTDPPSVIRTDGYRWFEPPIRRQWRTPPSPFPSVRVMDALVVRTDGYQYPTTVSVYSEDFLATRWSIQSTPSVIQFSTKKASVWPITLVKMWHTGFPVGLLVGIFFFGIQCFFGCKVSRKKNL